MSKKHKHKTPSERFREPSRVLYSPSWVVELGNCLYVADRDGDFPSKRYAQMAIDEFQSYRNGFNHDSARRVYLEKMFLIAESVSQGKRRRREDYKADFSELLEDRRIRIEEVRERDKRYGQWLDSWLSKALSFSGGFCLTKVAFDALANYYGWDKPEVDQIGWFLAVGAATGFPALVKGFQSRIFYGRVKGIEKEVRSQRKALRENWTRSIQEEYRMAIERAQLAWTESFGDLPLTEKKPENHVKKKA